MAIAVTLFKYVLFSPRTLIHRWLDTIKAHFINFENMKPNALINLI